MNNTIYDNLYDFRFTQHDIAYLKTLMPYADEEFWNWLADIDCSDIKIYAMQQGEIVFPREPLIRVEGPLVVAQLIETTLLNLVNYPSLIATNAIRMKIASQSKLDRMFTHYEDGRKRDDITLLEFGLRRAQGPDGGLSASKYAQIGGFSGSSNVLAGKLTGIDIRGTHAHSFVMSYRNFEDLKHHHLKKADGSEVNFLEIVLRKQKELGFLETNSGELYAFIAYAQSNPSGFVALVDTYDSLQSGVLNFLNVGAALLECGYRPIGIRLDSGDLAYLSKATRKLFMLADEKLNLKYFKYCKIFASNDLDEAVILSLNNQGHEIDVLAIGTHLVTCYDQPALGCVYKLVEINGEPRIKLSQETEKIVIPSKKSIYRLIGKDGHPIMDVMLHESEPVPKANERYLCRHPLAEAKRAYVSPSAVIPLLSLCYDGATGGIVGKIPSLKESQSLCLQGINNMREDHIRPLNPTPYKVSLSTYLFDFFHGLIQKETPITDLS